MALVERGGRARTFHVALADKETAHGIIVDNIARETRLHTDALYGGADKHFASHETVKHSAQEYVRGDVRKASSQFSSAQCTASISIAARSICIVTLPNLNLDTITEPD